MASIRFYIRKPDLVLMYVIFSRTQILRYSTGERCDPRDWSASRQRAISGTGYLKVNERLDNLEVKTREIITKIQRSGENVSTRMVKEHLKEFDGKIPTGGSRLITFSESFKNQLKNRGTDTWKSIGTTIKHLKEYERRYGALSFMDIDMVFYNQFLDYFRLHGYSKNFAGKMLKNVKWILAMAEDSGHPVHQAFKSSRFKSSSEEVYNIYLSVEELRKIHQYPFEGARRKVADIFLVACFTGLRYSDVCRLSGKHIGEYITQDMKKTSGRVVIPIHPIVREIFSRYPDKMPEPISNQKMNDALKLIGKDAGIDGDVIKTRTVGGVRTTYTFKKYELITNHTARRSFCTNLYLAGVPILTIMRLSGHKTMAAFMKYVKIGETEIAESMKDHPFFNS